MTTTTTTATSNDDIIVHLILTGASGYLGQHLLSHWIKEGLPSSISKYKITALYNRLEGFPDAVEEFRQCQVAENNVNGILDVTVRSIDLTDPNYSIESLIQEENTCTMSNKNSTTADPGTTTTKSIIIVVHTAALSSPKLCEENPERAKAINVPVIFFDNVLGINTKTTTNKNYSSSIIALSTDQVYDGNSQSNVNDNANLYNENEKEGLNPINVYGRTKLEMEEYILQQQQKSSSMLFALRSSIILGPKAPIQPNGVHGTFLDFVKSRGENNQETTFFINEFRNVVRVDFVLQTINDIITKRIVMNNDNICTTTADPMPVVFNMGGSERVNRMDMAKAVFTKFGYDHKLLLPTKQTSPTSPLDISMDSSLLQKYGFGIGKEVREEEEDDDDVKNRQPQPETYLGELVDYVFS
ncbi:MAG: dTDP-4-dehydrorhamnose reductase [Bacillariaceae sp.]|jgi:dTDP-4-dehydrorhamnose reductase